MQKETITTTKSKTREDCLVEGFEKAIQYIQYGFTPRRMAEDEFGLECHLFSHYAVKWCAVGAVILGIRSIPPPKHWGGVPVDVCPDWKDAIPIVWQAIKEEGQSVAMKYPNQSKFSEFCRWEETPGRTSEQVVQVLEKSITIVKGGDWPTDGLLKKPSS